MWFTGGDRADFPPRSKKDGRPARRGLGTHDARPDGTLYPNYSTFIEVLKPERIVYRHGGYREYGPSVRAISTWTFEVLGPKKTRVTMRMVFPSVD